MEWGCEMKFSLFNHYVDAPMWVLAMLEGSILIFAVHMAVTLRFASLPAEDLVLFGPIFPRAVVVAVVMLTLKVALGMYNTDSKWGKWQHYSIYLACYFLGFVFLSVIYYLFPEMLLGRGVLGLSLALGFMGVLTLRVLYFGLLDGETRGRRVLVIGAGSRSASIASLIESNNTVNRFELKGFISLPNEVADKKLVEGEYLLPNGMPLLSLVRQYEVDEVVVGVRQRRGGELSMTELLECRLEGINVIDLSSFYERETGKILLESVNPSWMVYSGGFNRGAIKNIIKATQDMIVSFVLLIVFAPIMLLTAIAIKLDSRGPVFYRQQRVGECGEVFDVLKFRSMTVDAEKEGKPQWAVKNDVRVTRVGKVIRLLRIDEIPQIINVLKGEMSFVGPRPERPHFVNELTRQIPYYAARHTVKPGVTGWAQVRYPYGASVDDARQKLQYDLYYAKNHSWFLDLIVLFQTVQVVLFGKGAR